MFTQAAGNSTALTVAQKNLTITASNQAVEYGTALALGTSAYTTSGLVNSDSVAAVTLLQAGNSTVPVTQDAGTYSGSTNGIIPSAATGTGLSNYSISYSSGSLTINTKTLTVTANARTVEYGTALVLGSSAYTTSGLVNSDAVNSVTLKYNSATTVPVTTAANTYVGGIVASAASGSGLNNYTIVYAANDLTVDRKALTVTADAQSSTYGSALILGSSAFTTSGLVNSDSVSSVTLTQASN
ncbi:hypothetical protein JZU69_04875, partial [bacterium]|nr:hypothetical protein [bacterium]